MLILLVKAKSSYTGPSLSDLSDIGQIIIALLSLILAGYIFLHQKEKDNKALLNAATLNKQNTKLQWFKELVIQPNLGPFWRFFTNLETIKAKISSDTLTEDEILEINRFIKDEAAKFRIQFYDSILHVDQPLYQKIKEEVADLITGLTNALSNDEHKFTNDKTFEREILTRIYYSKANIVSFLLSYTGT